VITAHLTDVVIASTVLNIVTISALVLGAVLFRDSLRAQARLTDRVHERDGKHVTALVDRLIAGDYSTFREYPDQDEEGGMELPEQEIEIEGGLVRRSTEATRASAEEELLLREDFPEVFSENR